MGQALQQYKAEHPALDGPALILQLLKDINQEGERNDGEKQQ